MGGARNNDDAAMKDLPNSKWGTTILDAIKRAGGLTIVYAVVVAIFVAIFFAVVWMGDLIAYEPTFEWWFGAYGIVGAIIATLIALVAFFGVWYEASLKWGAFAFIMGWLPSGILAFISWWLVLALWGPALIIIVAVNAYQNRN